MITPFKTMPDWNLVDFQLFLLFLVSLDVGGGGNCMFHVLAHCVFGNRDDHLHVRKAVCDHIEKNPHIFVEFLGDIPFSTYIQKMRTDRNWGDHLVLVAAANIYNRVIRVVNHTNTSTFIEPHPEFRNLNSVNSNIVIAHLPEQHYRATRQLPQQPNLQPCPQLDNHWSCSVCTFNKIGRAHV